MYTAVNYQKLDEDIPSTATPTKTTNKPWWTMPWVLFFLCIGAGMVSGFLSPELGAYKILSGCGWAGFAGATLYYIYAKFISSHDFMTPLDSCLGSFLNALVT